MNYTIEISRPAVKILDSLDRTTESRIRERLKDLIHNPVDPRLSNQLETAKDKRYSRVGDWRIIYRIEGKKILVVAIRHRREVYKKL